MGKGDREEGREGGGANGHSRLKESLLLPKAQVTVTSTLPSLMRLTRRRWGCKLARQRERGKDRETERDSVHMWRYAFCRLS